VRSGGLWSDCHDTGQQGAPPPREIDVLVDIPEDAPVGRAAVVVWGSSAELQVTAP
jgi:hypothetical protein